MDHALFQDVSDSKGNPESVFTLDPMLDDIMMYWLPNSGASSARLYWEAMQEMRQGGMPTTPMPTPTGISMFPGDVDGIRVAVRADLISSSSLDRRFNRLMMMMMVGGAFDSRQVIAD